MRIGGRGLQETVAKQGTDQANLEFTEEENRESPADQSRRKKDGAY